MRALAAGLALLVTADAFAEGHGRFAPSLSVSESYDDNLFSTPSDPQRDYVFRVSPGIEAGYYSLHAALVGRYNLGAEYFRDHPALSTPWARHDADLDLQLASAGGLRFDARQSYLQTYAPSELTPLTGLDLGRVRARRFASAETLSQRLGARSDGTLAYTLTDDDLAGGPHGRTHEGTLTLARVLGSRDSGSLSYGARRFEFEAEPTHTAQVALLGWEHELAARTRFKLSGGPRFGDGPVKAEAGFELRHQLKRGELALLASQTQTRVVGFDQPVTAQAVALNLTGQLGRAFSLTFAPGFARDSIDGSAANVYRVALEAGYRIARWLSLLVSDQYNFQRGLLGVTGTERIRHNVVSVSLAALVPEPKRRLGPERPGPERALPGRALPALPRPEPEAVPVEEPQQ